MWGAVCDWKAGARRLDRIRRGTRQMIAIHGYIFFAENGPKALNRFWNAAYAPVAQYGLRARLGACHDTRLRLASARYCIRGAGIVWRSLSAIRGRTIAQYQHYALLATAVHHLSMACDNTCQVKCRFTYSPLTHSE